MNYQVYFSNAGLPASGLAPVFTSLNKVSDGTSVSFPDISGVAVGWYKFSFTPTEDTVGIIYASGLSDTDAYVPCKFTINDESLDAAITTRPTINTIIASGNAANWSGVADLSTTNSKIDNIASSGVNWITASGFSTPANVSDGITQVIASGNQYWTTASGFSTYTQLTNVSGIVSQLPSISTIVASGDAAGWGAAASGMLTISDIYGALGLNASGLIDEISTLPVTPTLADAIYLSYMQRRDKLVTDKDTGKVTTYNDADTAVFTADVSDTGSIFTKSKLS